MSISGNDCSYPTSPAGKRCIAAAEIWKSKPCQSVTQRLLDTLPSTATSMASTLGVNGYNFLHGFEVHLWTGAAGGFIGGIFDNFFSGQIKCPKCTSARAEEGRLLTSEYPSSLQFSMQQGNVHTDTTKNSYKLNFPASMIASPIFVAMLLVAASGGPFTWTSIAAIAAGNVIGYASQPISHTVLTTNPCFEKGVSACKQSTLRGVKMAEQIVKCLIAYAASAGVATLIEFHQHENFNMNGSNSTNSSGSGDFSENQYQHPIHV